MRVGPTPPPHIFPTVSPVPAGDRARHRTRNHMVTTGRLVVSWELGSLPKECFKALIAPPQPRPCPAGTQMLAKALPLLPGGWTPPPTPELWKGRESKHLLFSGP